MKRIGIVLMLSSVAIMSMGSEIAQITHERRLARGQPEEKAITPLFAVENFEYTLSEISPYEVYALENLGNPIILERNGEEIRKVVINGIRKYRDVDWCSSGELYDFNFDKRSAITHKITRLPRGHSSKRID